MDCNGVERLLNPYLDGELDIVSALQVEEHLAACASCGGLYRKLQHLRDEIVAADLRFSPPPGLVRRMRAKRRSWYWPLLAAAACVGLLLLLPTYRLLRPDVSGRELLDSHLRSLMASHLVDVPSSDQHTVKPWFQGKLAFSPAVPDLSTEGFKLVGGRLDFAGRRPAAAIVYQRRQHVINLFIAPRGAVASRTGSETIEGYNIVAWTKDDLRYWAVSDLNAAELRRFAVLAGLR